MTYSLVFVFYAADGIDHVDDCAEDNGGCEHFCTDLIDGVECSCRDGYSLSENGISCVGKLEECKMYWSFFRIENILLNINQARLGAADEQES